MSDQNDRVVQLQPRAIKELGLDPQVERVVVDIQQALIAAYNDSLIKLATTVEKQAIALERIQETLHVMVKAIDKSGNLALPPVMRFAESNEDADLPSAVVIADPNKAGFTMTQTELAAALGLTSPDVSVLARAFGLPGDPKCAVQVGRGRRPVVVYHKHAVTRFRQLVASPPAGLTKAQRDTLRRVKRRLVTR